MEIPGNVTPASREIANAVKELGKIASYLKRIAYALENFEGNRAAGETVNDI